MYKIYINETLLVLTDSKTILKTSKQPTEELIVRYPGKPKFLLHYIDFAEKTKTCKCIQVHTDNVKKLYKDFKSLFKIVKAAGGLVINEKGEALLIHRKGFWDLPKGKLEGTEKKKAGALREVEEETGVQNIKITKKLKKTFHTYKEISKTRVLKETYWYLMKANKMKLSPQFEEGIDKAKWVKLNEFLAKDPVIFRNIDDIIKSYAKQAKLIKN